MRVERWQTYPQRESKIVGPSVGGHHGPVQMPGADGAEREQTCGDPKDGELCLYRVKPGETLVEARRGSNVEIFCALQSDPARGS